MLLFIFHLTNSGWSKVIGFGRAEILQESDV